jgi:hypothetical protein
MSGYKTNILMSIDRNEQEVDIEIIGNYYPGRKGRINCRIDDSYPPEPAEADIFAIKINGEYSDIELTEEEVDRACQIIIEQAESFSEEYGNER